MIAPAYSSALLRYCFCLCASRNCSFRSEPNTRPTGLFFVSNCFAVVLSICDGIAARPESISALVDPAVRTQDDHSRTHKLD